MIWKDYVAQKLTFLKKQNKTEEEPAAEMPLTNPAGIPEGTNPANVPELELEPEAEPLEGPALDGAEEAAPPVSTPHAQTDFEAGMLAFRAGNYTDALETLLRAAGTGHREAQFVCGQFYQRGLTADADCRRALFWYRRAAKQGLLLAQMSCAAMYEDGTGTDINMKRALYWYEQAAKQGAVDAQLKCGRMYYYGRAETRNPQKARRWLETAANQGCEDAGRLLREYF